MNRFLKYTTQEEPALTASFVAAIILAVISKFVLLTDDDLLLLGPIALVIAGVIIRAGVFSPATVAKLTGKDQEPKE